MAGIDRSTADGPARMFPRRIAELRDSLAGRVGAEADQRRRADQPVPGDRRAEPHGGQGPDDHHPRRREPAGPDDAVLGVDRTAHYIGWGKTTQLGYGLGLAMGAKLARPDHLCINVWGDAAIGFTGMDLETAARERIPILSILFNNFSMAIEIPIMPVSQAKYGPTDISGNYADMAEPRSAATASGSPTRARSSPPSSAASPPPRRAGPRCSSSSPTRRPPSPTSKCARYGLG